MTGSRLGLCGALLAIGLGGVLVGQGLRARPDARPAMAASPVNGGALDPSDLRANNSPALVRNPRDPANLAVVNRVDAPAFGCRLHVSGDGGRRWTETPIPLPAGEEPKCFAPDAAFAAGGALHISFVTLAGPANSPAAAWVATSGDGGRTLGPARRVLGPLAFGVRLAADPADPDRLYLTWLQAAQVGTLAFPDPGYPILATRSDDAGATWSPPVRVSPPGRPRVVGAVPAATPGGLVVAYLDLGDDSLDYHGAHQGRGGEPDAGPWALVVARSRDGGRTWREAAADDALVPTRRFVAFLPPTPSLAVRGADAVHVAFPDGRSGDADVWLWSSPDGGASWRRPTRVNDTPGGDGRTQRLPAVAVSTDGRIDVVYLDGRNDPDDVGAEVSLQSSYDGGRTFRPRARLSDRPFDTGIGVGGDKGLADLGSRLGLVSSPGAATVVWTDTRAGNPVSLKQDLARASVDLRDPRATSTAAMAAQLAGLAALVAAALVWRRSRQRPPDPSAGASPASPPASSPAGSSVADGTNRS